MVLTWVLIITTLVFISAVVLVLILNYRSTKSLGTSRLEVSLKHLSQLTGSLALLIGITGLIVTSYFQSVHEKSGRAANLEAARQAEEQRILLGKTLDALHQSSDQLRLNAEASQRAAAVLTEERNDQLRRPEIQIDLSVLNPAGGEGRTIAVIGPQNFRGSVTVICAEAQKDLSVRADLFNVGKAPLHAGSIHFEAASLDGGTDPTIIVDRVMGGLRLFSGEADEDVSMFTNSLSIPVRDLDVTRKNVEAHADLLLRVPRTAGTTQRTMKLSVFFAGLNAETLTGDLTLTLKFGEAGEPTYLQGQQSLNAHFDEQALRLFEKAASEGNGAAMTQLGYMYDAGMGVPQDYGRAREWYEKAIEATGDPTASNNLGFIYETGHGVPQDYQLALKWYTRAEATGSTFAMNNLGRLYEAGRGVQQNYRQALEWYTKASAGGNAWATYNLGNMYKNAEGVTRDDRLAARLYEKAAEAGNFDAMSEIGSMYLNGLGMMQDYKLARDWYEKAAAWRQHRRHEQYRIHVRQWPGGNARLQVGPRLVR